MPFNYWFVSRQKRRLTTILPALIAFNDVCVGKVWDSELQIEFEDALGDRDITDHGILRARRAGQGGGGTRTLFKQMKDLGLVFLEDENRKCRLTLIAEELIKGNISFVEAMRLQLQRYQYPSAAVWSGNGGIAHKFRVHPFQFIFRLLRDPRLDNVLYMSEMSGIVIHYAVSDSVEVFEDVVSRILLRRQGAECGFFPDTKRHTFVDIANTFFNYMSITQYVDRPIGRIKIRPGKESAVDAFIEENPSFIPNPELTENYIRRFGRGKAAMDRRRFDRENAISLRELTETRIRHEYVILALQTPVTGITPDIVQSISNRTGIDEQTVERFLIQNYPHGNIDDFFASYRELSRMGRDGAADFEIATKEMFKKIFKMKAERIGQIGNTPDVFVKSEEAGFCGIIDNKAYKIKYSITGDHRRVMEDVYIPNYKVYGKTTLPLAFFSYISLTFADTIDSQIANIVSDTGVNGSAMSVDLLINIAQDYAEKGYDHEFLKNVFSANKEVRLEDIDRAASQINRHA